MSVEMSGLGIQVTGLLVNAVVLSSRLPQPQCFQDGLKTRRPALFIGDADPLLCLLFPPSRSLDVTGSWAYLPSFECPHNRQ